jgi:hypothetical protein
MWQLQRVSSEWVNLSSKKSEFKRSTLNRSQLYNLLWEVPLCYCCYTLFIRNKPWSQPANTQQEQSTQTMPTSTWLTGSYRLPTTVIYSSPNPFGSYFYSLLGRPRLSSTRELARYTLSPYLFKEVLHSGWYAITGFPTLYKLQKASVWKVLLPGHIGLHSNQERQLCPEESSNFIFLECCFVASDLTGVSFSVPSWIVLPKPQPRNCLQEKESPSRTSLICQYCFSGTTAVQCLKTMASYILPSFPFVFETTLVVTT